MGLEQYSALAQSNLQLYSVLGDTDGTFTEITGRKILHEYIANKMEIGAFNVFDLYLFTMQMTELAGNSEEIKKLNNIDVLLERNISAFDNRLSSLLLCWASIVKTTFLLKIYSSKEQVNYYIEHGYLSQKYLPFLRNNSDILAPVILTAKSFLSESRINLMLLRHYIGDRPMNHQILESIIRHLTFIINNIEGANDLTIADAQAHGIRQSFEAHSYLSALINSTKDEEVRSFIAELNQQNTISVKLRVLDNAYIEDIASSQQVIPVYGEGQYSYANKIVRRGAIEVFDEQAKYAGLSLYFLREITVLNLRGHLAVQHLFVMDANTLYKPNGYKRRAELHGSFVYPGTHDYPLFHGEKHTVIEDKPTTFLEPQGGDILVLFPDSKPTLQNYSHWILDALPRLVATARACGNKVKVHFFYTKLHEYQYSSLSLLNIFSDDQFVFWSNPEFVKMYPIAFRNAAVVLPYTFCIGIYRGGNLYVFNPEAVLEVRKLMRNALKDVSPRRDVIYTPRTTRNVLNSAELEGYLDSIDVKKIDIVALPFEKQRQVFHDADIAVIPMGAGLANMIFMRENTTVITLTNENGYGGLYANLASVVGVNLVTVLCRDESTKSPGYDYVVDIEDMK